MIKRPSGLRRAAGDDTRAGLVRRWLQWEACKALVPWLRARGETIEPYNAEEHGP